MPRSRSRKWITPLVLGSSLILLLQRLPGPLGGHGTACTHADDPADEGGGLFFLHWDANQLFLHINRGFVYKLYRTIYMYIYICYILMSFLSCQGTPLLTKLAVEP